ncbi:hypothetical protein L249_4233, partial [Ophiocordyceps polyrhachis-furcata BCC 54312]
TRGLILAPSPRNGTASQEADETHEAGRRCLKANLPPHVAEPDDVRFVTRQMCGHGTVRCGYWPACKSAAEPASSLRQRYLTTVSTEDSAQSTRQAHPTRFRRKLRESGHITSITSHEAKPTLSISICMICLSRLIISKFFTTSFRGKSMYSYSFQHLHTTPLFPINDWKSLIAPNIVLIESPSPLSSAARLPNRPRHCNMICIKHVHKKPGRGKVQG